MPVKPNPAVIREGVMGLPCLEQMTLGGQRDREEMGIRTPITGENFARLDNIAVTLPAATTLAHRALEIMTPEGSHRRLHRMRGVNNRKGRPQQQPEAERAVDRN